MTGVTKSLAALIVEVDLVIESQEAMMAKLMADGADDAK